MIAKSYNRETFELEYNLGYLEVLRKNYRRAAILLQNAIRMQPDFLSTYKYLGISYTKERKYSKAVDCLQRWLESRPDDKEAYYHLAQCYFYLNHFEQAEKIFSQLRTDPGYGPKAAFFSGTIHMNRKEFEKAISDFDIGLQHNAIQPKIALELKYRLALSHEKISDLNSACKLYREIKETDPNFKDVRDQLKRCQELNANQSLKIFLMGTATEFTNLCRNIAGKYFDKGRARIVGVSPLEDDCLDILTEVITNKWEDLILLRFIRASGTLGDLVPRDFHSCMKEKRASRGVCFASAEYNDSARSYVEARLVDLVDKEALLKIFKKL